MFDDDHFAISGSKNKVGVFGAMYPWWIPEENKKQAKEKDANT